MLEAMGLTTGIDLPRLLDVRREVALKLPEEAWFGYTAAAGLPKGFGSAGDDFRRGV